MLGRGVYGFFLGLGVLFSGCMTAEERERERLWNEEVGLPKRLREERRFYFSERDWEIRKIYRMIKNVNAWYAINSDFVDLEEAREYSALFHEEELEIR